MPTTYPQALINPGAESGTTGWTATENSITSSDGVTPVSGTRTFRQTAGTFYQDIEVDPSLFLAVDHGQVTASASGYHRYSQVIGGTGTGYLRLEFYSEEDYLLGRADSASDSSAAFTQILHPDIPMPSGTRVVRLIVISSRVNSGISNWWDDLTLDLTDTEVADYAAEARVTQTASLGLVSQPAVDTRVTQAAVLAPTAAETASGEYEVYAHQFVAYALVRGVPETRKVRAWTFTQDDHDFYVLHLGADRTLVLDMLTNQWSVWKSEGKNIWRASVGMEWERDNIGGDVTVGLIWDVNPNVRSDDGVDGIAANRVPIRSILRGFYPVRMLNAVPCYRAVLTASTGNPVQDGVGIQLRTSDDMGLSWIDHGLLVMEETGHHYDISWASLGQMTQPGRIFEVIDTGYAARIDALDIDLGDGAEENG